MPQADWTLRPTIDPSPALIDFAGGHPLIAQLLAQRGFDTPQIAAPFLDPDAYTPSPPTALVGMARGADLVHRALAAGENILVWGDFDVDGQTSTSLLVAGLLALAEEPAQVRYHVPNRFTEGHGIRVPSLARWLDDPDWRPDLLLTCDTGVAEDEAVVLAVDAGVTVVITDHHDLPATFADYELGSEPTFSAAPPSSPTSIASIETRNSARSAQAIINPKLQPLGDPLRTIPGVGVAYKLVQQLYQLAGRAGEETEYLDLVALGIVADVAEQVNDARYLLQRGLDQLRATRRIGLLALMDVARLDQAKVDAESIGFQIGPRMNALGRLDDATVAVELLTTRDPIRAGQLAAQMNRLNQERRVLTDQITQGAFELIDRNPGLLEFNGLVLAHPNWHAGIVGIVASRLVDKFGKPTLLLLTPPGENARGSARSTSDVDIGSAIADCSDLLIRHGGHPGAAGVTLVAENVDKFRRRLSDAIDHHRIDGVPTGLAVDADLPFTQINLELADQLQRLAPFGNGNPEPILLTRNLTVTSDRRVGKEGNHRQLQVGSGEQKPISVIWFHGGDADLPESPIDLAYYLKINDYRGNRTVQLSFVAARSAQTDDVDIIQDRSAGKAHVLDWRGVSQDRMDLPAADAAVWYAEGVHLKDDGYAPRYEIHRAQRGRPLVLWTAPPSRQLLAWLIETVQPSTIYLVGREGGELSQSETLRNVGRMCAHALQSQGGVIDIGRMAARLGTTETVIRHSLGWLQAKGRIRRLNWMNGDNLTLAQGNDTEDPAALARVQTALNELLIEIRTYRRHFLKATPKQLGL